MSRDAGANAAVAALVGRLTADLEGVMSSASGGATEFQRSGQVFAAVHGSRISLRLRPDIAVAALRTPATGPSERGPEWIEFQPDPALPQDVDRLQAWLTIGWRSAQRSN